MFWSSSGGAAGGFWRKHWINWQELWTRDFSANQGRKSGGILDVFPTFSDEEWTEKIRPQPQTIYSVLPNGGGFSAAPLKPASYQFSCRDKKIAPGGICTKTLIKIWNTRTVFHLRVMRASPPTDFYEGFLNRDIFLALIRLALAGDVRATYTLWYDCHWQSSIF